VDVQTINMSYSQLQSESQQTVAALSALAQKLQTAAQNGDPNAREWMLDLKEVALGIQNEQNQTSNLLQALHNFVANQLQQPAPPYQQPPQLQQPGYQQQATSGTAAGGLLGRFTGGGFGRAIATGAGFGIGNDLINQIF